MLPIIMSIIASIYLHNPTAHNRIQYDYTRARGQSQYLVDLLTGTQRSFFVCVLSRLLCRSIPCVQVPITRVFVDANVMRINRTFPLSVHECVKRACDQDRNWFTGDRSITGTYGVDSASDVRQINAADSVSRGPTCRVSLGVNHARTTIANKQHHHNVPHTLTTLTVPLKTAVLKIRSRAHVTKQVFR